MGEISVLCGPPGCGKTKEILSRYVADVQRGGFDIAVLIVPSGAAEVVHEAWEIEGHEGDAHVDFITDDLAGFVTAVADVLRQGSLAAE